MEDQDEESDPEDKENISMNGMATPKKELRQNKVAMKTKGNNLRSDKMTSPMEVSIIFFTKEISFLLQLTFINIIVKYVTIISFLFLNVY